MKLRRLSLCLWPGFCLAVSGQTNSATYDGKTVGQWFQAYAAGAGTRVSPDAYSARNGEFVLLPTMKEERDPPWSAFQALGEKAVPFLIQRLPVSANESERTRVERRQAVELLHRLGECARPAGPALLALLPAGTDEQNEEICAALRAIHTDARLINEFLIGPGKRQSNTAFLQFARRLGWSGAEVAGRLGGMLNATDRELARTALSLLEAAGAEAGPAVDQIAATLRNSNPEMRYLAARALSQLATNTPAAAKALQAVAGDPDAMVRNVARRALVGLGSNSIPTSVGN